MPANSADRINLERRIQIGATIPRDPACIKGGPADRTYGYLVGDGSQREKVMSAVPVDIDTPPDPVTATLDVLLAESPDGP